MRLRTLPVSVAGVVTGTGLAILNDSFKWLPALLCLIFAILAQISSNFANEYYDFKDGLDRPGREGPRRGVTEGDITPSAMKIATFATLALACCVGLWLVLYGGWWLLLVGAVIAIGAIAYSAGPYPLSRHGLGEVAVLIFFGIIPVNLTYYVQTLEWDYAVQQAAFAIGLMAANVLIINNYRDVDDDRDVGKRTLAVIFGKEVMASIYLFNGYIAIGFMLPLWIMLPVWSWIVPLIYMGVHTMLWFKMHNRSGASLNPLLGLTAIAMLLYSFGTLIIACIY